MKGIIALLCILVGSVSLAIAITMIIIEGLALILVPVALSALLFAAGAILLDD